MFVLLPRKQYVRKKNALVSEEFVHTEEQNATKVVQEQFKCIN
jgi:hypothetical protein